MSERARTFSDTATVSPGHSTPIVIAAADGAAREAIPQRYSSEPASFASQGVMAAIVDAARQRWGADGFLVDAQVTEVRPGMYPGIPVWRPAPETGDGSLVACLADEPLLEVAGAAAGERVGGNALAHLADGARVRFHSPSNKQVVATVLVRPRAGLHAWNLPRYSARVFAPRVRLTGDWPGWASARDVELHSDIEVVAPMPAFTDEDILAEPTMGGATFSHARDHGGPIAQAWLERLPREWRDDQLAVGIRRHELSPGWSPGDGRWHLDINLSTPRRSDGRADLLQPLHALHSVVACVGRGAPTAYIRGSLRLPNPPVGTPEGESGQVWHHLVEEQVAAGRVEVGRAPRNHLFSLRWGSLHASAPSLEPGWRCFIAAMRPRGEGHPMYPVTRTVIVWPSDGPQWPSDDLGVFPRDLPLARLATHGPSRAP